MTDRAGVPTPNRSAGPLGWFLSEVPPFEVFLLESSKIWLSNFSYLTKLHDNWQVRWVDRAATLVERVKESRFAFSVIEIDRHSIHERFSLVRQLVQLSDLKYESRHALAIVGQAKLGQDEWSAKGGEVNSKVASQKSEDFLELERLLRAAGAVHCCWNVGELTQLVRLINRFGQSLPERPITLKEHYFKRLPWPKASEFPAQN